MTPSIRTFLLINLLLSVTLITSLAIIGNLFLAHKNIQVQLDSQLIRTSLRMQAFFSGGIEKEDLATVQRSLDRYLSIKPKPIANIQPSANEQLPKTSNDLEFQVWDAAGKLILHSPHAPNVALSEGNPGLSTLWLNGTAWRVNTSYNADNKLSIMVAEQSDYRQRLENELTQDSVFIMLLTYPFLGVLIWVIVGRGLNALRKVADEVRRRAPRNLKPVALESVPSEIEPLVSELNDLFERLQEAFTRNERFTSDAAHELKTPLAALSAQTQVALRAKTPQDRNEALLKVLTGVDRSTHVVQQLLTLSRIAPEASHHNPEPVDLGSQAREIAALLVPKAIEKDIELELITRDNTIIQGHSTAIDILLRNLIDNAIRYSPSGSLVQVVIERRMGHVTLSVIDNGPGIPQELRERVFERFFRVTGTQATGSGLGLGIVLQIVKLHRANIKLLTADDGHGLKVFIEFPT